MINEVNVNGEVIQLKKSKLFGWRVVHPNFNSDGKINWMNLLVGGKGNLIVLIFILILSALSYYGLNILLASCKHMAANPCLYVNWQKCM